ncbi:UDP-glucuronosyltransferase 1A1-like [Rhincodon typus]|uniref:UDP-glucuronosyltransferase 1A1-like n=1 Tax=Rhincodon typus TaxID=259920 RepID=UPI00202E34FE|nr:UDP-glucuronosyltransferase 1A1-like [Rhincodon typus]
MAVTSRLACLLACLQCLWSPADGGKLLVIPVDGSHWLSIKLIVEEIHGRGHQVVIVKPENSLLIKTPLHYTTISFPVSYSKAEVDELYVSLIQMAFYDGTFYQKLSQTLQHVDKIRQYFLRICEDLLFNTRLLEELAKEHFDALLTDPFSPCGAIVAEYLSLPTVNLLRGLPCGLDNSATQCPRPLSYVPRIFTGNTDRMTFLQRTLNVLANFAESLLCHFIYSPFEELAQRFLQRDVTLVQLLSKASIWLMRYDFTIEYPKPLMPNMVLVGGINCQERKPLSQMVHWQCHPAKYGNLHWRSPQEGSWNVHEAWRPDAHPKTRAFLTHGGSHGVYEAICSAVPMLLLPLFSDQIENAERLKVQGVGVVMSLKDLSSQGLVEALNTVINDTRYKEVITKMSSLYKDRPVQPLEISAYWVEFVMRHRGAEHLQAAAHDYNWIQYHCLDVIGTLAAVVFLFFCLVFKCCLFCLRRAKGRAKRKCD